jgi:hypothetical protein
VNNKENYVNLKCLRSGIFHGAEIYSFNLLQMYMYEFHFTEISNRCARYKPFLTKTEELSTVEVSLCPVSVKQQFLNEK